MNTDDRSNIVARSLRQTNAPIQDDPLTRRSIACAIEVHKKLGPGLLEKSYKEAMITGLELNGLKAERNGKVSVEHKGRSIGDYFIDLLVEDTVIFELKELCDLCGHDLAR